MVVPPSEVKTSIVDVPEVATGVTLLAGVNIASIAQLLDVKVTTSGLVVYVTAPVDAAYSKHRKLKPVPATASKETAVPLA